MRNNTLERELYQAIDDQVDAALGTDDPAYAASIIQDATNAVLAVFNKHKIAAHEIVEQAYVALLRSGSYRVHVQTELCALRDFLAMSSGQSAQEVQDFFESQALMGKP